MIVINAGRASVRSSKSIFVTEVSIKNPTTIRAGAVANDGIARKIGERNRERANKRADTKEVRPVRPPSATPEATDTPTPTPSVTPDAGSDTEKASTDTTSEDDSEEDDSTDNLSAEAPRIKLSTNRVTIKKGESINRISYVESVTDDKDSKETLYKRIEISGDTFDKDTPGTYEQTYYVVDTDGNRSNEAKLTIVVQ